MWGVFCEVRAGYRRRDFFFVDLRFVVFRFVALRRELLRVVLRFALRFLAMCPTSSQWFCTKLVHNIKEQ